MIANQLGARLRQARMAAGLSKSQAVKLFDRRAGISHPVLIRIEVGHQEPTAYQLQQFCAAYDIPAEYLYADPVRFPSVKAAFQAMADEVITEDRFLCWLLIDRGLQPEGVKER